MNMAKIYYNRLLIGTITFDAIPARYQEAVKDLAKADVKKGKLSVLEYELLFHEDYSEEA